MSYDLMIILCSSILTSLQFSQFKKLNKELVFLLICFTFLNYVRLTSPHQNTQKFAKFTATGEA